VYTNEDRAAVAEKAVEVFGRESCPNEDLETMAADLVTNILHMLRRRCDYKEGDLEMWLNARFQSHNEERAEDDEE